VSARTIFHGSKSSMRPMGVLGDRGQDLAKIEFWIQSVELG
jgi:hypothetical protein